MKNLFVYLKNYKKECILGPSFKLFEAILELMVPLVMAKIIDIGIIKKDIPYILKMGIFMITLGIIGLLSALICQYFAAKASQGCGTLLRNDLFKHINSLSYNEIDKIGTPSLITRIINDINSIQVAIAMAIRLGVRTPFLIIGSTVMAMTINLKLSLIFIISIPFIVVTLYLIMSKSLPYYKKIQQKLDKLSLITNENLHGIRVVHAFSNESKEKNRFEQCAKDLTSNAVIVGKISSLLNPLTYIIMNISIVFIIWFGGIEVNLGNFTQGELIAFVNYMTQILLTLIVVANLVIIFTKAQASLQRVNEVFNLSSSIIDGKGKAIKDNYKIIEFNNVSFSYNNTNKYALDNITFSINKGETIGIIGGTGSGKTTLLNLLTRNYDTTLGEVLFKGINIKTLHVKTFKNQFKIAPQNPVLFSGTIKDNLLFSNNNITENEINKALEISQSLEFVSKLEKGIYTKVNQGGKNFSGGQKQRLTIARALCSKGEVLILDDSSSALDYKTDYSLRNEIKKLNITTIIVSQRASSIMNADKIIVLDNGKLAALGTHKELLENSMIYKEICLSQLSKEEVL